MTTHAAAAPLRHLKPRRLPVQSDHYKINLIRKRPKKFAVKIEHQSPLINDISSSSSQQRSPDVDIDILSYYRDFLRLSKYYSHIPAIQATYRGYVKSRFRHNNKDNTHHLLNTLAFVNNACCIDGQKEYTILKNLIQCWYQVMDISRSGSRKYGEQKMDMKKYMTSVAIDKTMDISGRKEFEDCVDKFNKSLDLSL